MNKPLALRSGGSVMSLRNAVFILSFLCCLATVWYVTTVSEDNVALASAAGNGTTTIKNLCVLHDDTCTLPYLYRSKAVPVACAHKNRQHFDHGLANVMATAVLAKNSNVIELDPLFGCYTTYMNSTKLFRRWQRGEWHQLEQIAATALPPTHPDANDWLLAIDTMPRHNQSLGALEQVFAHFAKITRFGVILGWQMTRPMVHHLDPDEALLEPMDKAGFVHDAMLTEKLRTYASGAWAKRTIYAFNKRQLVATQTPVDFLVPKKSSEVRDAVPWNDAILYAGIRFRTYIAADASWDGKVVVGIHSDNKALEIRNVIRSTWAGRLVDQGNSYKFLIAQPTYEVYQEANTFSDIMLIDALDMYNANQSALPLRTHSWLQMAGKKAKQADWVFKLDHDTILFPDNLVENVLPTVAKDGNPQNDILFIGAMFNVQPIRDSKKYTRAYVDAEIYPSIQYPRFMSGGAGYCISIAGARCVTRYSGDESYRYFPREDVSVSLSMRAACYPWKMFDYSKWFHPGSMSLKPPKETVTIHYVKQGSDIEKVWNQHIGVTTPAATTAPPVKPGTNAAGDYVPLCRRPDYKCLLVKYQSSLPTFECDKAHREQGVTASGLWNVTPNYIYWFDQSMAEQLLRLVAGGDVLELGAGFGCYSAYWKASNQISSIVAVDGAKDVDVVTRGLVQRADLSERLDLKRTFDWVIMLEVAEHVPKEFEDVLLQNLRRHAGNLVISWAVPGQGGNGHVNLQTNEYVIDKLTGMGWKHDPVATQQLRDSATLGWFKNTPLVFRDA